MFARLSVRLFVVALCLFAITGEKSQFVIPHPIPGKFERELQQPPRRKFCLSPSKQASLGEIFRTVTTLDRVWFDGLLLGQ